MPASHRTKLIVWSVVAVIALTVAWFAYGFFTAYHRFMSEERICGAFQPVISALDQYHQQTVRYRPISPS